MDSYQSGVKPKDQAPGKKPATAPKRGTSDKKADAIQQKGRSPESGRKENRRGAGRTGQESPQNVMSVADDMQPSEFDSSALPNTAVSENAEERHQKISAAAYARAERRGFDPGKEDEDWLTAEAELYGSDSNTDSRANERENQGNARDE